MKKNFLILAVAFNMLVPYFAVSAATSSIRTDAFDQLGAAAGSSGAGFGSYTDPRELAAKIIKTSLGVIGIIFVGLAIYAGFQWMTAGGNDEQIGTAKKLLYNAAIGLAVILAAYSLTIFVFNSLIRSTTQMNIDNQYADYCDENPTDPQCAL